MREADLGRDLQQAADEALTPMYTCAACGRDYVTPLAAQACAVRDEED